MSATEHILSIDLGTGGPKVALVSARGEIAAATQRPVQTRTLPPSGAEQDPEAIWRAIVSACREVLGAARLPDGAIRAVICSSQYFSIVPIDASGRPVGDLILWLDGRGAPHALALYGAHSEAFPKWLEIAGMPPLPTGNDSLSHMLFLQQERPDVYARAHKLVEAMDYVTARLSGVCTANPCTAFAQLLTDNRRLDAVCYDDELLAMSGIDREKLPELVEPGAAVGPVQKDVAEEIGLPADTPVLSGLNDTQAVALGAGVFRGRHGGVNVGTTCQLLAFTDALGADIESSLVAMPSPLPGRYTVMAENGLGGKTVEHFLECFVFASDALGDHATADPYAGVEAALRDTAPGAGGLLYLPWLTGAQAPSANAAMRGGFLNLTLETRRVDLLRAVVEGVSYGLRAQLPAVERFAGREFDELTFSGGGALSDTWAQVMADVMDRPVLQLEDARQVNNLGGALLAFERLGRLSFEDVESLRRVRRRYEPEPRGREAYAQLFPQFLAAFEQTRPIFEALNGEGNVLEKLAAGDGERAR